ncbi:hypothetical protein F2Q70_00001659 [Brassica cretica]|uniref:Uncharacterized protein n=1 Tax=Brassica cretica TaxID=69181 RepID=A0A8S9J225_BRACR|nr:hypothetical protein F2Q70_00001659 [Brassica cretica]
MKSPRRWHQPESLSLESSSLSLWSTIPRLPRRIRLSLSLSLSRRRFRVSGALFDDSASLSISSTPPRISRSPRRLRVSLDLLDASAYLSLSAYLKLITPPISSEIKPKEKAKFFSFYV